eukprot:m.461947 g.461947  ORF g.461947 m.461947 type:complete len:493 (+) comp22464_c0_seq1:248-1726(+)
MVVVASVLAVHRVVFVLFVTAAVGLHALGRGPRIDPTPATRTHLVDGASGRPRPSTNSRARVPPMPDENSNAPEFVQHTGTGTVTPPERLNNLPESHNKDNPHCQIFRGASSLVANACDVFLADTRAQLASFFRDGGPVVRLGIVDGEARFPGKSIEKSSCSFRFNKSVLKFGRTESDFAHKFAAELLLPRGLRNSAHIEIVGVDKADYVMVEMCNIGVMNSGEAIREIAPFIMKNTTLKEMWKNHKAKFLLTLTGDHGPCIQSNEKAGQTKTRRWIDDSLRGATKLMSEGSKQGGCYDPPSDVVIPTSAILVEQDPLRCPRVERKHLAFFTGKLDSLVRRDISKKFSGDSRFYIPERVQSGNDYLCAMSASTFCLAPRGNAAWSPRLDEALYAGCIPVLLADNYNPPFSTILNYSTFSITVDENHFASLGELLDSVSTARKQELLDNGAKIRSFFRYKSYLDIGSDKSPNRMFDFDASALVAFELWRKLQG